jgi:hypothetical protein
VYGNVVTFYTYDVLDMSRVTVWLIGLNKEHKINVPRMLDILWHAGWKGSVQWVTVESNILRSASVKVKEFID